MFLGTYRIKFTGRGRVVLPKKLRIELKGQETVILSKGLDKCVWGFEKSGWEKEAELQLEIPLSEEKGRVLRRTLFSGAEEVEIDNQGRIVIPDLLINHAGIKGEVLIIGAGDHFEIWNPRVLKETEQTEER